MEFHLSIWYLMQKAWINELPFHTHLSRLAPQYTVQSLDKGLERSKVKLKRSITSKYDSVSG